MNKQMKIQISEAARKSLDALPQAERAAIMKDFMAAVQNGSFIAKSKPVNMAKLKKEEPELWAQIQRARAEIKNEKRNS